jgi:2-oxoglutarate dehydrogenase E1 component
MWEAQFGDFVNGAQVIIDQFISSGERKWLRMSGLVMLLPHGYEGPGAGALLGARLERFLQSLRRGQHAGGNCSTPANYFHILRRQVHRDFRKPLIIMTPKSLLRHKRCVSTSPTWPRAASFHRVLLTMPSAARQSSVISLAADKDIRRVVLCSGKVYYDLLEEREKRGIDNVYLMRRRTALSVPDEGADERELARFRQGCRDVVWCQEEPKNMGSWTFVEPWIELTLEKLSVKSKRARYVGRPASASTAAGLMSRHLKELDAFLTDAFA